MSTLLERQFRFSGMLGQLIAWLYEQGYTCQLGDAWRSTDKLYVPSGGPGYDDDLRYTYQELLFYNRRSKVVHSKHNDRLAVDLTIYKNRAAISDTDYRLIGEKWESMGGRWGGRFGVSREEYNIRIGWDPGHFEL